MIAGQIKSDGKPLVSIITAVFNRASTVADAMESVLSQSYPSIEYILVDGMSNDGTDQVVHRYRDRIAVSIREPDQGIYDALNKGVRHATGDIIGFLHADDLLASPDAVAKVVEKLQRENVEGVYGNLIYISHDQAQKVIRYWKSGTYDVLNFRWGWMPPHPTVYLRRSCYERFGSFREDFQIAADYELLVRMMVHNRITMGYVDDVLVKMRVGGKSNASLSNRLRANAEDRKAWELNGMSPPMGLRFLKPLRKVPQYWTKPPSG